MKKIILLLLLVGFAAPSYSYYEDMEIMHYGGFMDSERLFDEAGCLIPEIAGITDSDMPCLDPDESGCVTHESWEAFMEYWRINTPKPEIPLCEQMSRN